MVKSADIHFDSYGGIDTIVLLPLLGNLPLGKPPKYKLRSTGKWKKKKKEEKSHLDFLGITQIVG